VPADDTLAALANLAIEVVYCPVPGQTDLTALRLAPGATVADALVASGVLDRHTLTLEGLRVGVWFRQQPLQTALRDQDRVEIYRPLQVDPKEARRLRYKGRQRG
jgi:putative ubiquitin-RnfH superfamily antitoxin RatB of RatAB toxin-antitoxin module